MVLKDSLLFYFIEKCNSDKILKSILGNNKLDFHSAYVNSLKYSVKTKNVEAVIGLLKNKRYSGSEPEELILEAIKLDSKCIVGLLINNSVISESVKRRSLLMSVNNEEMFEFVINSIKVINESNQAVLEKISREGNVGVVKIFLKNIVDIKKINIKYALKIAINSNNREIAMLLILNKYFNIKYGNQVILPLLLTTEHQDLVDLSELILPLLITNGDHYLVNLLLKSNKNLSSDKSKYRSLLHYTIYVNDIDMVKLLINEEGICCEHWDKDFVIKSIDEGLDYIIGLLEDDRCDIKFFSPKEDALSALIINSNIEQIIKILKKDTKINSRNIEKIIFEAIMVGNINIIDYLFNNNCFLE